MGRRGVGILVLAGAFLLGSLMAERVPWKAARASPADVRGSGNVLVAGFRNRAGSFLLWSSGRITRPDGQEVNGPTDYTAAPGFAPARRVRDQAVGSGNVAVGVVPEGSATNVVFSDGSVRRPNHPEAAAAPLDQRVTWGFVEAGPSYGQGSGDWTIGSNADQSFHVTFNPPFGGKPAVVTGGSSGAYRLVRVGPSGFDLYSVEGHAPDRNVPFSFVASGN